MAKKTQSNEPTLEQYRPLGNYILIEKVRQKEGEIVTDGGIVIPESADKKHEHLIARVLKIGPGVLLDDGTRVPPDFQVGDIVVINPYDGRVPNPRLSLKELILPASSVLAVWEDYERE